MVQDPAFLFYPGDYLRDTQCLSEKVQVAYDRIMCEHMRNICISHAQLKFFTKKLNDDEISELKMVLKETPEGFQIEWVLNSIEKRKAYSVSRRKNRSGKAKTHEEDKNNICRTYDSHMENENENENVKEVIGSKESEKRGKRASSCPADFQPTEEMVKWAIGLGVQDLVSETEHFKDHHAAKGSAFKDWSAAWRNWIRNSVKFSVKLKIKDPEMDRLKNLKIFS